MGGRCSRRSSSLPSCKRSGPIIERPKPVSGGRSLSFAISSASTLASAFESPPPPSARLSSTDGASGPPGGRDLGQLGGGPRRFVRGVGPHDPLGVVLGGRRRRGGGLEAAHALRVGFELCQLLRRVHRPLLPQHARRRCSRKRISLLLWTAAGKAAKAAAWRHSSPTA